MQIGINSNSFYISDYTRVDNNSQNSSDKNDKDKTAQNSKNELTPQDYQKIAKLQARDAEVRAHEMAHQSAGGGFTGGASFTYEKGPDGKMYAVGGEVPISMPSSNDPKERKSQARQVITAALAPADPSPQDYSVASKAKIIEIKADQEILKEMAKEIEGKKSYQNEDTNQTQFDYIDISA